MREDLYYYITFEDVSFFFREREIPRVSIPRGDARFCFFFFGRKMHEKRKRSETRPKLKIAVAD